MDTFAVELEQDPQLDDLVSQLEQFEQQWNEATLLLTEMCQIHATGVSKDIVKRIERIHQSSFITSEINLAAFTSNPSVCNQPIVMGKLTDKLIIGINTVLAYLETLVKKSTAALVRYFLYRPRPATVTTKELAEFRQAKSDVARFDVWAKPYGNEYYRKLLAAKNDTKVALLSFVGTANTVKSLLKTKIAPEITKLTEFNLTGRNKPDDTTLGNIISLFDEVTSEQSKFINVPGFTPVFESAHESTPKQVAKIRKLLKAAKEEKVILSETGSLDLVNLLPSEADYNEVLKVLYKAEDMSKIFNGFNDEVAKCIKSIQAMPDNELNDVFSNTIDNLKLITREASAVVLSTSAACRMNILIFKDMYLMRSRADLLGITKTKV